MADRINAQKYLCKGGLNSNENHLFLAETTPGGATRLVNYEPSVYGGYRRINGFEAYDTDYPEVGAGSAEGPVLCIVLFKNTGMGNPYAIAARKDIGTDTYSFYKHTPGIGWVAMTTGLTFDTTDGTNTVHRVRHIQFDFGGGIQIAFADGVNNGVIFDGTTWTALDPTAIGSQALAAPAIIDVFENHLFMGGDPTTPSVVSYSAPNNADDFTTASGAGQVTTGFPVVQHKPFRDNLFVFGTTTIKKITADVTAGFVLEDVTANVGCIARDSVQEVGGDLIFLSPDGLRPVAGTSRIGDVELATISRPIHSRILTLIENNEVDDLCSVVIRSKSQVRFFFSGEDIAVANSEGVLGGLTASQGDIAWEFADIMGMRANCSSSEYIGKTEYVLHGDYNGTVYQQEIGNAFDGEDIVAIFSTPFLDMGETEVRKVFHKLNTYYRAEGPFTMNVSLQYDWGDANAPVPASYTESSDGSPTVWGGRGVNYGGANALYGGNSRPVITTNIQGSGYSVRVNYVTTGQDASYSIQGFVLEFGTAGRR